MEMNEYQVGALKTAEYTNTEVVWSQLPEEVGEIFALKKRYLRGDLPFWDFKINLHKEIGDVLWTLSVLADDMGMSLEEIARENLNKLKDRQDRGVLKGAGDSR
jgi:NTP pyrophosphatase (non-canonical NTP hydrolase)